MQQIIDPGEPGDPGYYICHATDMPVSTVTSTPVEGTMETTSAAPPTITGLPSTGGDADGPGSARGVLLLVAAGAVLVSGAGMVLAGEMRSRERTDLRQR